MNVADLPIEDIFIVGFLPSFSRCGGLHVWEARCLHHGHREQVDRKDRRDKGLLRIGRLWLKAILKRANRDLAPKTLGRIKAQLTHCLLFSRRNHRLCFFIYLH